MRLRNIWMAAVVVGLFSSAASAGSFTFATAPGALNGTGQAVSASAMITTGAGTVTIVLSDTLAFTNDAGQLLSDVFFTLNGGTIASTKDAATNSTSVATATSGSLINIDAAGAVTAAAGAPTWGIDLTGAAGGTIHLCDIGGGNCTVSGQTPAETMIGPGPYAASNGSIDGNGPHNPFISQSATWVLSVPNVTAATSVTGVVFSFGTVAGDNVPGCTAAGLCTPNVPVPEPASLTLLGSGLVGIAAGIRRRRKQA